MLLRWIYVFLFLVIASVVFSQEMQEDIDTSSFITLHPNALFFIKNNEYKSPLSKGFTGLGAIFKPQLQFQIDSKASFKVGYFFLKYSGLNSLSEAIPLLSFTYEWSEQISLRLGAIDGNLSHKLDQAHYQIDRYYQNHIEYGFQLNIQSQVIQSELWLDWQQFIQREDPFPEKFVVGLNSRIRLVDHAPIQLFIHSENVISHIGGEIDVSNDGVQTTWNTNLGLELQFDKWVLKTSYFYFMLSQSGHQSTTKRQLPFEKGYALKFGIGYASKKCSTHIFYWNANDYFSPMGEPLLLSVSDYDPNVYIPSRNIMMQDLSYILIDQKNYDISFYLNNYFDLDQKQLSSSIELRALVDLSYKFTGVQLESL